jgi:tripartite-type tricarboxylate transporter receptor subunit TctC
MRTLIAAVVVLAAFLAPAGLAAYPERPLRLVVPFPPGGSVDLVGRALGQKLSEALEQSVVVDNRPGAGGNLGTDLVAKARPDGYTLLVAGIATHAISPSLYPTLPYDPVRDFAPVSLLTDMPNVLVVHPSVQATSVRELVALAKARPRSLMFASSGPGTSLYLSSALLQRAAGIELVHVPYKGNAASMPDLLAGKVQLMFDNISNSLPQIAAGKLRVLAVTGARRSPALPDVPTMVEAGYPGLVVTSWLGLFAPAGTSPEIVERLNKVAVAGLRDNRLRAQLGAQGIETIGSTPAELLAHLQREKDRWARIIQQEGIKLQ